MSQRLTSQTTLGEAKDYVLFYKYLSFDEDFGAEGEQLLMEVGRVLDSMSDSDSIPENLLKLLVDKFGYEYD